MSLRKHALSRIFSHKGKGEVMENKLERKCREHITVDLRLQILEQISHLKSMELKTEGKRIRK